MAEEACIKCGSQLFNPTYCEGKPYRCLQVITSEDQGEHLDWTCGRCGFMWLSSCVDAKNWGKDEKI
jgi:hypothetical protein